VRNWRRWLLRVLRAGDGGFGGPSEGQPEPHQVPPPRAGPVDRYIDPPGSGADLSALRRPQILYIAIPNSPKRAGFARPILHGMCTFGMTCRGNLADLCRLWTPGAFRQHVCAVLLAGLSPARTVTMDIWKDGNVISFEAKVKARQRRSDQERQEACLVKTIPK